MASRVLMCVFAGSWVAMSFVAAMFASARGIPVSAAFATLIVVGLIALAPRVRSQVGPRAPLALGIGALLLGPFVFLGGLEALSHPLVSSHFRCGTGDAMLIMIAPFVLFGWGAAASALGLVIAGSQERRGLDRGVRIVPVFALIGAIALLSLASMRARGRVEPDAWSFAQKGTELAWQSTSETSARATAVGQSFFRTCSKEGYCSMTLRENTGPHDGIGIGSATATISVARVGDTFVFTSPESQWPYGALDSAGQRTDLTVRTLATELSAPKPWIVCGFIAMGVAIALLVRARATSVDLRGLSDGVVAEGGAILLDDGSSWPQNRWPEGTRVIARRTESVQTFREDATPIFTAGTIESLRRDARANKTTWASFALVTIALGVAPMLAALQCRIAI